MDIKYKGISKKDITKIQEIHMPKYSIAPTIDDYALAQLRSFERKEISDAIDNVWKQNENDLNIYIVCEMAKKYLDVMEEKKYCCTCKWYAEFEGVCCNADSKWTADFRCLDDTCDCWMDDYYGQPDKCPRCGQVLEGWIDGRKNKGKKK